MEKHLCKAFAEKEGRKCLNEISDYVQQHSIASTFDSCCVEQIQNSSTISLTDEILTFEWIINVCIVDFRLLYCVVESHCFRHCCRQMRFTNNITYYNIGRMRLRRTKIYNLWLKTQTNTHTHSTLLHNINPHSTVHTYTRARAFTNSRTFPTSLQFFYALTFAWWICLLQI